MDRYTENPATEIGSAQILALRSEAIDAGDDVQVEVCDQALAGQRFALAECVRVIAESKARAAR